MTPHRQGIWLSGLLMLSLVGCTTLSPPKPPAPGPKVEVSVEAPEPPDHPAAPLAEAPKVEPPPPAEATREAALAQAQPPAPPGPPTTPPALTPAAPPGPPAPPPAPAPAAQRGKFVILNFDNADIEVVIHAASEIVGFNYVLAPEVKGKVTIQTSSRIPQEEVFNVLLAILEVHGFTAIKSDALYKIIRLEGAREHPVPTVVGAAPDPTRVGDEIITQIIPIRFASVAELSNLLRPLISARGSLIPHRETNLLIITDTASNIRRLLDIVKLVDVEVTLEELQVIPVKYADAEEIARILNQIFSSGRIRAAGLPAVAPTPVPPTPGAPPVPGRPPVEGAAAERPPLIVAYRGINVLIVHARKNELEVIRRLLTQLDVDIYGGRRIFIYFVENAKAKDLAATMNAIYGRGEGAAAAPGAAPRPAGPAAPYAPPTPTPPAPSALPGAATPPGGPETGLAAGEVRFIADEVTNSVIVTTFPRNWPDIEATLKKLDRMPRQVLIEVLVAEITLTDDTRLGIEWAWRQGRFDLFNAPTPPGTAGGTLSPRPGFSIPSFSTITGLAQGLNFFTFQTDRFFTALNALAADNKVNVLSSPSILTAENKKAVINVSDSIPIVTSQQVPIVGVTTTTATTPSPTPVGTQTVEYKDVGVVLTVTPRIGERGTVALDIKQEVNDVGAPTPPTNSLSFVKREAETSMVLTNNQTLALGGLIKNRRTVSRSGIPILNRIPLLGLLFGNTEEKIEKTELLILITPRVLGTALDAARLTEEMKRITPGIRDVIRQAPRPPSSFPPPPGPPPTKSPQP